MVKLKEGQFVEDTQGNTFLVEEGDCVKSLYERKDKYAIHKASHGRLYLYDDWLEKPLTYSTVESEKEAIFVAKGKWGVSEYRIKIE
jgi:hypothetical protein